MPTDTHAVKEEKKSGAARTQLAVRDEWWSDERVQSFLELETSAGETPDFHILVKAYRGMVPEAFVRFIDYFLAAGRNINEKGPNGETILAITSAHKNGTEYSQILKDAGAE